MWFLGIDWAEQHHDACLMDETGTVLAHQRIPDTLAGASQLQALIARHGTAPEEVVVGIETDRGLLVSLLVGSGYQVYAINPLSISRYRERHSLSHAKSDPADAKLLADVVRTDRQNHRAVMPSSPQGQAVAILARSHQRLIWGQQRHVNQLRNQLREFYPGALLAFGDEVGSRDALAVLAQAPTPAQGRALSLAELVALLRQGGRQRYLPTTAKKLHAALLVPQLEMPAVLSAAYGASVQGLVGVIASYSRQIAELEEQLQTAFKAHPDANILLSLPGLGEILGARVLGGFGDAPNRYVDSRARRNYAGSSPITRASGKQRIVHARFPRNAWLADAGYQWAFCSLRRSPGARAYYKALRNRKHSHNRALRSLANRWFGILHGCLRDHAEYSEDKAWSNAAGTDSTK
ncbi:MAG: IS110 family transposase [Chloroflexota bacterium]|nr:IS110 family transposase [Chloroflexota bacterium]